MDNQLFRQKSIDRISSPEQLHDYMRVTSPRLWMILAVIIALVVGLIIFSTLATMESTLDVTITVERYTYEVTDEGTNEDVMIITMEIPMDYKDTVVPGMEVRFANKKGTIDFIYMDQNGLAASVVMPADEKLPNGEYPGEVVLDRKTPIDFLLN